MSRTLYKLPELCTVFIEYLLIRREREREREREEEEEEEEEGAPLSLSACCPSSFASMTLLRSHTFLPSAL